MWLQFENNVAAVPGNEAFVLLETADGETVSEECYTVSLPDVELEFGFRQYMWIDVKGLDAGSGYVIHVKPGITAKNGLVSDSETRIAFSTAAEGEATAALANPDQVAGKTGNGDGTGGGRQGQGAGASSGGAAGLGSAGASEPSAGVSENAKVSAESSASNGVGQSDGKVGGNAPGVVYVDERGQPIKGQAPVSKPMPIGEVMLIVLCVTIVVSALALTLQRSRANVIRRRK